jgi:hypothetical protein
MSENIQRSRGRGQGYKFDRGGNPAEFGPFIGEVRNNVDSNRSGRLQVYIEQFGGDDPDDKTLWRTVSYVPPFYGSVAQSGTDTGTGDYIGNPQSYGMWFTPPDIGTMVICFFVAGDPNQGYYMGCIPDPAVNHMIPAIGASKNFDLGDSKDKSYFSKAKQLPVTEINVENEEIDDNPRFFDQKKPVHSYVAGIMLQQGLIDDTVRGPITSNSQRESPSSVYGISTPGRPVYQAGLNENKENIVDKTNSDAKRLEDVKIIGRRGGHSIVMDDGDLQGFDNLIRIRTSKGHQITMSDDGDCFYIIHANGQSWIELGTEGTVDVYSTNSVNVRTEGEINLHADKNINMFAGESINIKSKLVKINSTDALDVAADGQLNLYGKGGAGLSSDGALGLKSEGGGWDGGGSLNFKGGTIDLNGGSGPGKVDKPTLIEDLELPDTIFQDQVGWKVEEGKLTTIVTRAPTHEPYPYHNRGVEARTSLDEGGSGGSGAASTTTATTATPATTTATAAPATTPAPTTPPAVAQLATQPVTAPVNVAQVLKQTPATAAIGNLTPRDVTGLMSSAAASVGQNFNVFSADKGIGKFGFSPVQLEQTGFLKPGTVSKYLGNSSALNAVLLSPTVWTGKNNVSGLNGILDNVNLQGLIQQDLMRQGYTQLQKTGVIKGLEPVTAIAPLVQSTVKFGPAAVGQWASGQANQQVVNQINALAKNAQQAISVVTSKLGLGNFGGIIAAIAGVTQTVSRNVVNSAVVNVIDNPKVPPPEFDPKDRTIRIDIRAEQQDARGKAYADARAAGKSEAESQNISAAVGNNVGAAALARESARFGI